MTDNAVYAPATIANFTVGFDALGACIEPIDGSLFGDKVYIEKSSSQDIQVVGDYKYKLPTIKKDNVVAKCIEFFHAKLKTRKIPTDNFVLTLDKGLPVCSGLGSSAASIVAAIVALNKYYDSVLPVIDVLHLAAEIEGVISGGKHYDNVAPCLLGGLQLLQPDGSNKTLPWFIDWHIVLYYPGIEIATKMAREILPKSYTLSEVTQYWQRFGCFIHALHTSDIKAIKSIFSDDLIEPYRAKLIPNFDAIKQQALANKAITFGVSGSGPACFALTETLDAAKEVQSNIERNFLSTDGICKICRIATEGARTIEE